MEKYDTSQLTEFPRFESESSQSSVSTFFNKFWKLPLFTPSEGAENGQSKGSGQEKQDATRPEHQDKEEYESGKPETGTYAVELEGRSLPNVLRRISSLVALGSGGGTRYADTELARYWMPDDISRECYECATRFSTLRRRHHCRVCGQIFCSRCCSQRVPGHIFGCNGGLRVCNYCCNVVLSYLKEHDLTGEISPDLRTLQENLQVKFPDNKDLSSKSRDNFVFAHDQEERCEIRNSPKEALQDVFRQLSFALPTQQHRNEPSKHEELVQKLQKNLKITNKNLQNVLSELAQFEVDKIKASNPKYLFMFKKEATPEFNRAVLKGLEGEGMFLVLISEEQDKPKEGQILIQGPEEHCNALGQQITDLLKGKGAFKNGKFQGKAGDLDSVNKCKKLIEDYFNNV